MRFPIDSSASDVSNNTGNVAFNVYERVRDLEWTYPTSNPSGPGPIAQGTSKANAITQLKTISKGVEDKGTFFRYRFRRKMKMTSVRTD